MISFVAAAALPPVLAPTAAVELEPAVVALVPGLSVSEWALSQVPDDRSPSAVAPSCLSLTGT